MRKAVKESFHYYSLLITRLPSLLITTPALLPILSFNLSAICESSLSLALRFKMRSNLMVALALIPLLLLAGSCCSARLLENDLFTAPANPNFNSLANGHMEKDAVLEYDEENSHWVSSSAASSKNSKNEISELSFKLSPSTENINKADESPSWNKVEGVLILMTKGAARLQVNLMQMTGQRLSKSRKSPGVGHMQMSPHKSQPRNVDTHHINGNDKSNKRKRRLGSTPSPGAGH